jgi:hypothetical protein
VRRVGAEALVKTRRDRHAARGSVKRCLATSQDR